MSKSKRLNKEILSKSIDETLGMDDTDLVNNVIDILVSYDITQESVEFRPRVSRKRGIVGAFINHMAAASEMVQRITDWLFPVPKTPTSFYADIW